MPRIERLMLFLRGDRESEGRPRVFARSNKVGDERAGVELSAGSEGECVMEGILDALKVGLFTDSSDGSVGFS